MIVGRILWRETLQLAQILAMLKIENTYHFMFYRVYMQIIEVVIKSFKIIDKLTTIKLISKFLIYNPKMSKKVIGK